MYKLIINKTKKIEYESYEEAVKNYLKAYKKYDRVKLLDDKNEIIAIKAWK